MSLVLSTWVACFLAMFAAPAPELLTVAAAADLADAQAELASAFAHLQPGVKLRFVTGASGQLAQQITHGAPYDVFLSANPGYITQLLATGKLTRNSAVTYAFGRLAIQWRDGRFHPLSALIEPWVRVIAIPNPQVAPYGVAAREALQHFGLWDRVQSKIVLGENVRQSRQLFDSGNADVVLTAFSLIPRGTAIPVVAYSALEQQGAIVATTHHVASGRAFLEFLQGAAGGQVLQEHRLAPVPRTSSSGTHR